MPKLLNYRITRGVDKKPVIVLDFDHRGNNFEFRLDGVRKLAASLSQIADDAQAQNMGRGYSESKGEAKL